MKTRSDDSERVFCFLKTTIKYNESVTKPMEDKKESIGL